MSALAIAVLLVTACSSHRSSTADTTDTTTTAANTTAPTSETTIVEPTSTTATPTSTPATAPGTTTTPTTQPTTTTAPCTAVGDTARQASADPLLMTFAFGADIRTGRHVCFERLVIEAANGDFPGWSVEYVDDPVRLGESDDMVFIRGDATLSVRISMWMPTMEGVGYPGPIQIFPSNVDHILELRETENWEGMCIWSIGLDEEYPFTVHPLHNPERLVIDFQIPIES